MRALHGFQLKIPAAGTLLPFQDQQAPAAAPAQGPALASLSAPAVSRVYYRASFHGGPLLLTQTPPRGQAPQTQALYPSADHHTAWHTERSSVILSQIHRSNYTTTRITDLSITRTGDGFLTRNTELLQILSLGSFYLGAGK